MMNSLSGPEMTAYYAGRREAAAGHAGSGPAPSGSCAEAAAFTAGFKDRQEEEESRRLLAVCRSLAHESVLGLGVAPSPHMSQADLNG